MVVLREFETGCRIDAWSYRNQNDAERKRYSLKENPLTRDCHIEIEVYWHPETPPQIKNW
jgi:hypothetical protein